MKARPWSLPTMSFLCAWPLLAYLSMGSRAAGAAASPLERRSAPAAAAGAATYAKPSFFSAGEQALAASTLAAALRARSRLSKRAARPASESSAGGGDVPFSSKSSSQSLSSSVPAPPRLSGVRQAVQGLWGKVQQGLWPTRPKAKDYSFDQLQRLETLMSEIVDPDLRKCVTEQAFGWSQGWPSSRVTLSTAEVERTAPNVPPNIVGVLSALMRRCNELAHNSDDPTPGHRRRRMRITRGKGSPQSSSSSSSSSSPQNTGDDTATKPNSHNQGGAAGSSDPPRTNNGVYADWVDNWWEEEPSTHQPRSAPKNSKAQNHGEGSGGSGSSGQAELGETISNERARSMQEQLEQAWRRQHGEPPAPPSSTTQFSVLEPRPPMQREPPGAEKVPAVEALRYLQDVARGRRRLFALASGGENSSNDGPKRGTWVGAAGGPGWLPKVGRAGLVMPPR